MSLKRFWIRFKSIPPYNSLRLGCGVTALNYDDALTIVKDTVFEGGDLPDIESVIENVDLSALDPKHVVPNMEPWVWRGVWFPKGFSFPK